MRILIVKIGAIGDVVMSMAMLPYLRKQYPGCSITWVCGKIVAPLLRDLVDELIVVDERKLLVGKAKIFALIGVWKRLFFRKYDLVLTAHPDPRYRLISLPVRATERRSWDRQTSRIMPVPGRYHAKEYLRLASGVDGPEASPVVLPTIFTPACKIEGPYVAIAPGGAKNVLAENAQRRWPIENYAKVIEELAGQSIRVVVTGAPSDAWVLPHLPAGKFINAIGAGDLLDTIAIYKSCSLLLTHDSGPLHLAKLAKCPVIALFGPTNPSDFADESVQVIWGGEHLPCRPCYDGKTFAACSNNLCLKSISPQKVLDKAIQLLDCQRKLNPVKLF